MVFMHTAHSSVNVDNPVTIGDRILEKMVGEKVSDFSFKKKDQAVTMGSKNGVKGLCNLSHISSFKSLL